MAVGKSSYQIVNNPRRFFLTVFFCAGINVWGETNQAESLAEALAGLNNVKAQFTQTVTDGYGQVVEKSTGEIALARPNARWEVKKPYPQILILSGSRLQIYDPDLEQVTERDITEDWEQVPLALLMGAHRKLSEHYLITAVAEAEVLKFRLLPLAPTVFASIEITFGDDRLEEVVITDSGDQRTIVEFRNHRVGQVIQSELFQLKLPLDTDVIRG